MTSPTSLFDPRRAPAFLAVALAVIFLFLFFRNAGIYPVVFIDEWVYSSATRMLPLADAQVPSYLYFKFFRLTRFCGDSYLDCNRLLNGLFYVLASPFIYLIARRVAPAWPAVLVAIVAALAPNNAYTPFFMPEAMHYFAFWCVSWAAFYFHDRPSARRALPLGALLGLAVLVKMHVLFLGPAMALFVLYAAHAEQRGDAGRWLARGALWAALALGTAMAVRLGLGYLLAGNNGLGLFGSLYTGQVAYTAKSHYPVAQLILFAWHNLQGHLMLLALLFAVPLAALLGSFNMLRPAGAPERGLQAVAVYTVLALGTLLAVTIMFTASITGLAASDSTARIHTRYYDFALPLLLLCAAAAAYAPSRPLKPLARALIGALLLLLLWHARAHLLHWFAPILIDTPELRVVSMEKWMFNALTALALLSLLLWTVSQKAGLRLFFVLVLPATTLMCAWGTAREVRLSIWPDPASKAGLFARHYLTRAQTDRLLIVATDIAVLHRSRFFIENPNSEILMLQPGQALAWDMVPAGRQWVMAIGQLQAPKDARVVASKDDLLLFQTPALDPVGKRFNFNEPITDYGRIDGLAAYDTWGAWSQEQQVIIEFARPLPKRFTLKFEGRAFGPNAGKDVVVTVGAQQQVMRMAAADGEAVLRFDTDGQARLITFKIPQPVSPKALGIDNDTRPLGIGFGHMTITDDDAAAR